MLNFVKFNLWPTHIQRVVSSPKMKRLQLTGYCWKGQHVGFPMISHLINRIYDTSRNKRMKKSFKTFFWGVYNMHFQVYFQECQTGYTYTVHIVHFVFCCNGVFCIHGKRVLESWILGYHLPKANECIMVLFNGLVSFWREHCNVSLYYLGATSLILTTLCTLLFHHKGRKCL